MEFPNKNGWVNRRFPETVKYKTVIEELLFVRMSIYADDVAEFTRKRKAGKKLGDVLAGRFSGLELDSVEEVRKLRERK